MKKPSDATKTRSSRRRHAARRELIENLPEGLCAAGPQRRRRHRQAPIDLVHDRKHGNDGERQQRMRHRKDNGGAAEQQLVSTRHPGGRHDLGHDSVPPEQNHPGKILDQRAGPEWQQDKQHGNALLTRRLAAQPIGQRVAQRQTQHGGPEGNGERRRQDRKIWPAIPDPCKGRKGWRSRFVEQAHRQHLRCRQEQKQDQEHDSGKSEPKRLDLQLPPPRQRHDRKRDAIRH